MTSERSDIVRDAAGFETPDTHSSSQEYSARFSGSAGKWFLQVQQEAGGRLLADLERGSVLEAGGGHGQNLELLVRAGHAVTVLGSDQSCTRMIQPFLQRGEVTFTSGPLTEMPFEDKSFDVAVSYRMLAHLHDWRDHIRELCRVSRRAVLVEFPVRCGFNALSGMLFKAKKKVERSTRPYSLFDETVITAEFLNCRFYPNSKVPQFFWPMAFHRLHGSAVMGRLLEAPPRALGLTDLFGSPVIARYDRKEE